MARISCPDDCVYLDSGNDYQQKRLADLFAPIRREFYRELSDLGGDKAAALFNWIEVMTFSYFETRRGGQDAEVIAAIQALRHALSPLHIPTAPLPLFAEHLKKEFEAFRKQSHDQIADPSNAAEVLDRIIRFISGFSGNDFQSRRFLGGLIGYVKTHYPQIAAYLQRKHQSGHIVLPGQSFIPPISEPHVHGPECEHQHR